MAKQKVVALVAGNRNWRYDVGQTVKAGPGLPLKQGTKLTIKTRVPGVAEPGYIVKTAHNGDYWVRESEVHL